MNKGRQDIKDDVASPSVGSHSEGTVFVRPSLNMDQIVPIGSH